MAQKPSKTFGTQLRRVREAHGWSQRELVRRAAEIGLTIDPATVHRIETGQRTVGLDETFALAAIVGVSPLHLAVPTEAGAEVELAEQLTVTASAARRWVRGRQWLPGADQDQQHWFTLFVPDEEAAAKTRELVATAELANAETRLRQAKREGRPEQLLESLRADVNKAYDVYQEAEEWAREVGA